MIAKGIDTKSLVCTNRLNLNNNKNGTQIFADIADFITDFNSDKPE